MAQLMVARAGDSLVEEHDWGRLVWMVSGPRGNSDTLTFGQCLLKPGRGNPVHYHPNCDEILHVVRGRIRHRVGEQYTNLTAGDTISIPTGQLHNAHNLGDEEAELVICFSSAQRQTVGEGGAGS